MPDPTTPVTPRAASPFSSQTPVRREPVAEPPVTIIDTRVPGAPMLGHGLPGGFRQGVRRPDGTCEFVLEPADGSGREPSGQPDTEDGVPRPGNGSL